jgi:hypothetical protein
MGKSNKGGAWERQFSKILSLWWSNGEDDSWFWRTGGSGSRATQRAKKGKTTANGAGDICAQTPKAQELMNHLCIENKRGYNAVSLSDLLDNNGGQMLKFVEQAKKAASLSGAEYWAVAHKRDRREAVLITNCPHFAQPTSPVIIHRTESPLDFIYMLRLTDALCSESRERIIREVLDKYRN